MSQSNFVNQTTRLAIYKRDNFTCTFCNKKLDRDYNDLTIDHVIARSKDEGTHDIHNLVLACRSCNCTKQDLSVWYFCLKMGFDFMEVDRRIRKNTLNSLDLSRSLELLDKMTYIDALQTI